MYNIHPPIAFAPLYEGHGKFDEGDESFLDIGQLILAKLRRAGQLDVEQDHPPVRRERELPKPLVVDSLI